MATRPRAGATSGGLQALNEANDATRLDTLLHQYFRLGMPVTAASNRRRKRPHDSSLSRGFTTSNEETVTPESALKQLKTFLKESKDDKHILRVVDAVQSQLKKAKKHKPLVPLVVRLCSELFTRSAVFRSTIASQAAAFYQQLLEGAGEKNFATKRRRMASSTSAEEGVSQSVEVDLVLGLIEAWRDNYGSRYPTIVAGYAGLEDNGYVFPRVDERAKHAQARETQEQQQQEALRRIRLRKMESEMARSVPEMETTITEMDTVFEILVPTLDAFELELEKAEAALGTAKKTVVEAPARVQEEEEEEEEDSVEWEEVEASEKEAEKEDAEDGVEWEDVADGVEQDQEPDEEKEEEEEEPEDMMDINDIVQAYGLGSSSYQLTISISTTLCEKSSENEVLFRSLTDGVLQIRKRFLPLVRDWLQVADVDSNTAIGKPRDTVLVSQLRDLQTRLEAATLKWEDLVKESDRKRFARVQPRVVSLPLTAFSSHSHQQQLTTDPSRRATPRRTGR